MDRRKQLESYKTDEERFRHLDEVPWTDWGIIAQWEEETEDPKYKRIFHDAAVSLCHMEEYHSSGDF